MITLTFCGILVLCAGVFTIHFSKATEDAILIISDCNQDITLPCTPTSKGRVYMSITWYKVNDIGDEGIIRRTYKNPKPELYSNYGNIASLTENNSLVLKNVTVRHAGRYKCFLAANLGQKNNHSVVRLNVSECVTITAPAPAFTGTSVPQSTEVQSTVMELRKTEEINALLAFVGFSTIGLTKVLLSAVCMWVSSLCALLQCWIIFKV